MHICIGRHQKNLVYAFTQEVPKQVHPLRHVTSVLDLLPKMADSNVIEMGKQIISSLIELHGFMRVVSILE